MPGLTLDTLRGRVRSQTQTTVGELPDALVDGWLQEAFNRTVAYENQWPWYEKTWDLAVAVDAFVIEVPTDCNVSGITGLTETATGYRLPITPHTNAQDTWGYYSGTTGGTNWLAASVWAGEFILWPNAPAASIKNFKLTGFRYATDWVAGGPSAEPDMDPRLHPALLHFATALAYAQQEDETLESSYMQRWQTEVNTVRNAIMEPSQARPLIMGPHRITGIGNQNSRYSRPNIVINTSGGTTTAPGVLDGGDL